jgi:hypothetical protein
MRQHDDREDCMIFGPYRLNLFLLDLFKMEDRLYNVYTDRLTNQPAALCCENCIYTTKIADESDNRLDQGVTPRSRTPLSSSAVQTRYILLPSRSPSQTRAPLAPVCPFDPPDQVSTVCARDQRTCPEDPLRSSHG